MTYAGFWQRFFAGLIDTLVFLPLFFLQNWLEADSKTAAYALALPMAFAFTIYSVYCHATFGKTLGKQILGIRVVKLNGQALGWRGALLRDSVMMLFSALQAVSMVWAIAHIPDALYYDATWTNRMSRLAAFEPQALSWVNTASLIWFWSELLVMLLNPQRRSLHDYLAGSLVITEQGSSSAVSAAG